MSTYVIVNRVYHNLYIIGTVVVETTILSPAMDTDEVFWVVKH